MNLRQRLDRIEQFGVEIPRLVADRPPDAAERMLQMREAFNDECVATAHAICSDPYMREHHEVFAAMQAALEVLRSRVVTHQMKWDADRIKRDRAGYFEAAQPVQDLVREFVTNARVFLRD